MMVTIATNLAFSSKYDSNLLYRRTEEFWHNYCQGYTMRFVGQDCIQTCRLISHRSQIPGRIRQTKRIM